MIFGENDLSGLNQTGDFSTQISDLFQDWIWPAVDYFCMAILIILYVANISRDPECCELSFDQCLMQTCDNKLRDKTQCRRSSTTRSKRRSM